MDDSAPVQKKSKGKICNHIEYVGVDVCDYDGKIDTAASLAFAFSLAIKAYGGDKPLLGGEVLCVKELPYEFIVTSVYNNGLVENGEEPPVLKRVTKNTRVEFLCRGDLDGVPYDTTLQKNVSPCFKNLWLTTGSKLKWRPPHVSFADPEVAEVAKPDVVVCEDPKDICLKTFRALNEIEEKINISRPTEDTMCFLSLLDDYFEEEIADSQEKKPIVHLVHLPIEFACGTLTDEQIEVLMKAIVDSHEHLHLTIAITLSTVDEWKRDDFWAVFNVTNAHEVRERKSMNDGTEDIQYWGSVVGKYLCLAIGVE